MTTMMKQQAFLLGLVMVVVMATGCEGEKQTKNAKQPATQEIDAAIAKGVAWLKSKSKDGMWMVKVGDKEFPNPAYTALAITPVALSLPPAERAQDPTVAKAAAFILAALQEDGAIRQGPASKYDNYFTACSLMALSVINDPAHAAQRKKMSDFLLTLQRQDKARIKGGFGYNTAKDSDLSNTQFAIEALRSAGLPEDHPAMEEARKYLERAQNRSENEENAGKVWEMKVPELGTVKVVSGNDGSAPYEPGVSKAGLQKLPDGTYVARGYGSMTYALLKCYILVGLDAKDERVASALQWLGDHYTWDLNPGFDEVAKTRPEAPFWALYYYYMTAAKALRIAGLQTLDTPDGPRNWRDDLSVAIRKRQAANGSWTNSKAERWEEGDPLVATSYALIALHEIKGSK